MIVGPSDVLTSLPPLPRLLAAFACLGLAAGLFAQAPRSAFRAASPAATVTQRVGLYQTLVDRLDTVRR